MLKLLVTLKKIVKKPILRVQNTKHRLSIPSYQPKGHPRVFLYNQAALNGSFREHVLRCIELANLKGCRVIKVQ